MFLAYGTHDIDVIIKSRNSNEFGKFEKGWNVFQRLHYINLLKITC